METLKIKQETISNLKGIVKTWENKFNFSLVSFVFFLVVTLINLVNPVFGNISKIVLSIVTLVFTQQVIRSFNYLKYSKKTLAMYEVVFDEIDKM